MGLHKRLHGTSIESNTAWAKSFPTCINARTCEEKLFMAPHKIVTVNGRRYDAVTGLPIEEVPVTNSDKQPVKSPKKPTAPKPAPRTSRGITNSEIIHSSTQRSQTLLRRVAKKPATPSKPVTKRKSPGRHMDIAKSASVSRFAKNPVVKPAESPVIASSTKTPSTAKPAVKRTQKADRPAKTHPLAKRAVARVTAKKKLAESKPVTAKQVKDAEIAKALAVPKAKTPKTTRRTQKQNKTLRRVLIIGGIIFVLLALAFTVWRLVPAISVSVAASQAGINASYPEYTPDGYSLSQPVTFDDGRVTLKFASHSNDDYYIVEQTRSSWDSSAILDNVVTPAVGAGYGTTKERGLTIYTYENNAVWVNGGILYKIEGKASLSSDQIRRIAMSL